MTPGKTLLHFIICYCLSPSSNSSTLSPSVLKGGLVYSEESSLGPVYLNRDYVTFVRTVNTSALEQSAQTTRDFTTLYHTLCHTISKHLTPFDKQNQNDPDNQTKPIDEVVFSPVKYYIREGRQVCKNMGARLPEIRDKDSSNRFRFAAIQKGITKFPAGVHFDQKTQTFRYDTDDTPANFNHGKSYFKKMNYGAEYTSKNFQGEWEWDSYLVREGPKWFLFYNNPEKEITIRMADSVDKEHKDYIMCVKLLDKTFEKLSAENNLLLQLADNACKRDKRALVASTRYILTEIEMVTNLDIKIQPYTPKMEDFFPLILDEEKEGEGINRNKRNNESTQLDEEDLMRRIRREKTEEEVTRDISELNTSFQILISLLNRPKEEKEGTTLESEEATTKPTPCTYWVHPETTPRPTRSTTTTTTTTTTEAPFVKGEFIWNQRPTEAPISRNMPRYLTELYDLYVIQKLADVHQYPFDVWMYKRSTARHKHRHLPDIFRGRRNYPEQTNPNMYLSTILYNSTNRTEEMTKRAEFFATDMLYKHQINKRIDDAIDDYLDSVMAEDTDFNKTTLDKLIQQTQTKLEDTMKKEKEGRTRRTPSSMVTSMMANDAPFSGLGEVVGYLLGIPTKNSAEFKQITRNAKNINNLNINQNTLNQAFNTMSNRLTTIGNLVLNTFKAAATSIMEQDLKQMIRHMQILQQLTLTKYANVLIAGQVGKTSPYAMSQSELIEQRNNIKIESGLIITDRIEDTKSTITVVNNSIRIIIQAPILEDKKLFNFYHIRPLPVFRDNKTYSREIDTEYIAISRNGAYYTEVTSAEFTRCVLKPDQCQVSSPSTPVGSRSTCVITSFINNRPACPIIETTKKPEPLILVSGNRTIYSVPYETHLYVKCYDHAGSHRFKDETLNISGIGEATFRPSCTITLPGGATFDTPAGTIEEHLSGSRLFEILKTHDPHNDVVIQRPPQKFPDLPIINLKELDDTTVWETLFEPNNMYPFFIRLGSILTTIAIVCLIAYCCCPGLTTACCARMCRSDARKKYKIKQQYKRAKEHEEELKEQKSEQASLLNQLTTQLDELSKSPHTTPKRWPSIPHFVQPQTRPTSQTDIKSDSEEVDNPIPPPIGSPHLSYKLKDIENGHNSKISSPIIKRVQFE